MYIVRLMELEWVLESMASRCHVTDGSDGHPWEWENLVGFPHGLSRQLQLLSIAVSLSLQNDTYISKEYESWLSSEDLPLVLSGKTKKAPELKLAEWGSGSWMKTMESSLRTALDSRTWLLLSITKPPKQYLKQQQSFTLLLNLWVGWARPGSFLLGIFHALVFIVADTWSAQRFLHSHIKHLGWKTQTTEGRNTSSSWCGPSTWYLQDGHTWGRKFPDWVSQEKPAEVAFLF